MLIAACVFIYYSDLYNYNWLPLNNFVLSDNFTHEIYRSFFLIPMLYTALVFKFRGAILISAIVFLATLPRSLFISPNPDPLLRTATFFLLVGAAIVLLGFAEDRVMHEKKALGDLAIASESIQHLNTVLNALRNINKLITRGKNRNELIDGFCKILIEEGTYYSVWIVLADDNNQVTAWAEAGLGEKVLTLIEQLRKGMLTSCYRQAMAKPDIVIINDTTSACADCSLSREESHASAMTIRLEHGGRIYGVLCASTLSSIAENREERSLFQEVASDIAFGLDRLEIEMERQHLQNDATKRWKELQCLYNIANIIERPEVTINDLCQEVAQLMPNSWHLPQMTAVRIRLYDREFITDNFRDSSWKVSTDLRVHGHEVGRVEVYYVEKPEADAGPFSEEEKLLINAVGERLGRAIERIQDEDILRNQEIILEASAEELRQSRQRIITIQESLRKEIAQELHGTVQGRLIVVLHELEELESRVTEKETTEKLKHAHQILEELQDRILRPVTQRLYPSILRRGLIPAFQSLGDQFETKFDVEMILDKELANRERTDNKFILEQSRLAAYRIAEEAMINISKHAKASKVRIEIKQQSNEWFRIIIKDNGRGFDAVNSPRGLGLSIMEDYAATLGGDCRISSKPGKGTEVVATLPISGPGVEYPKIAVS